MKSIIVSRGTQAAVALALLTAIGFVALRAGAYSPPHFPRNERGLTFGTASDVSNSDYAPDLIAATATNGRSGFVLRTELEIAEQRAANPVEAVKKMKGLEAAAAGAFLESVSDQLGADLSRQDVAATVAALKTAEPKRGRALLRKLGVDVAAHSDARANAVVVEALGKAEAATIRRIKVYESDGETVIGVFEVGGGQVFAVMPEDYAP